MGCFPAVYLIYIQPLQMWKLSWNVWTLENLDKLLTMLRFEHFPLLPTYIEKRVWEVKDSNKSSGLSGQIKCEDVGSSLCCTARNYIQQNCCPSLSLTGHSGQSQRVELNVRKQELPSLLPWHYLCRSLSRRPVTLLWLFCWPYNGFLCTHATRRLAEIIFFSCLARLQLRNKLLMEARGRLLIIGASHPVDLFPTLFSSFAIAQLQWQEKRKQSVP